MIVLLFVIALVASPEAWAQSLVLPATVPQSPADGPSSLGGAPRLVDAGVSWIAGDGAGRHYVLRSDSGRTPQTLTVLPAVPHGVPGFVFPETFDLELSDQAFAIGRVDESCAGYTACKYMFYDLVEQDVVLATPGAAPKSIAGCAPTLAAHACDGAIFCSRSATGLAVSGDSVAFVDDPCGPAHSHNVTVHQASGASRSFPGGVPFAMAGPYLADTQQVTTASGAQAPTVVVYDRTTGMERARVPATGLGAVAIQPDGTLAVLYAGTTAFGGASRLAWASLAQPYLHDLGNTTSPFVRIAAAHLLTDELSDTIPGGGKLVERGLDGTTLQQGVVPAAPSQIDFDGNRFAYSVMPCALSDIVVSSSLAEPTPPELQARCPTPAFAASTIKLVRGRLATPLACPADPYLGCAGMLRLVAQSRTRRQRRRSIVLSYGPYQLDPGQSRSVSVTLSHRARRFVAQHRELVVIANATATSNPLTPKPQVRPAVTEATLTLVRSG